MFFIYFWDRDRAWAGEEQRERETQNLKQAPGSELSAQSPTWGSNSRTARSWPEPKSDAQPTEPPRHPCYCKYFFKCLFVFETERDRAWTGEGQRERETQNPKQAPGSELSAQSPTWGSNSRTARSWPEPKSDAQPTEPPRHPWKFFVVN